MCGGKQVHDWQGGSATSASWVLKHGLMAPCRCSECQNAGPIIGAPAGSGAATMTATSDAPAAVGALANEASKLLSLGSLQVHRVTLPASSQAGCECLSSAACTDAARPWRH